MADEGGEEGEEEVGRVGGWIASIDKLLSDPLGVLCLQVSTIHSSVCAMCIRVHVCIYSVYVVYCVYV